MKKPLVVIIDDEIPILQALEAQLVPTFESICRFELFDDPRDALASVTRWAADRRSLAVAIVDQKMPHLTGGELLVRLHEAGAEERGRGFSPVEHMKVLILTGYAGLPYALQAKNEAGVDRYIEKPWDNRSLVHAVRALLQRHFESAGTLLHFVFREATTAAEIREHLALRYLVYKVTGGLESLLPGSSRAGGATQLDVDCYDRFSILLGLFASDQSGVRMVGTMRLTGEAAAPVTPALEKELESAPDLLVRFRDAPQHALPMLAYLADGEAVLRLLAAIAERGERVVEAGRFGLHPGFQRFGTAAGSFYLSKHMVDGAVAFAFFFREIENALLSCAPPHDRVYKKIGFSEIPGTRRLFNQHLGVIAVAMHGTRDGVPQNVRQRIDSLAIRLTRAGGACRCATFPDCLPGPYQSGEFSGTDLFCPLQAGQILKGGTTPP